MAAESANARPVKSNANAPRILCTGIIVLDEVFRVEEFPRDDGKVEAKEFFTVNGGCAANAAVAIARQLLMTPKGAVLVQRQLRSPWSDRLHTAKALGWHAFFYREY